MKNEKGFSLVELLVVVIIIAIIAAIAIPNLLASRRAANEASAINSLRTYHSAQATFQATDAAGAYGTFVQLGGAGLVDTTLGVAAPDKSGYLFTAGQPPVADLYCIVAAPSSVGTTGTRRFGVNQRGVIHFDAAAAVTCGDAAAQYALTGAAID